MNGLNKNARATQRMEPHKQKGVKLTPQIQNLAKRAGAGALVALMLLSVSCQNAQNDSIEKNVDTSKIVNIKDSNEENFIDDETWDAVLKGAKRGHIELPTKYYAKHFADKLSISVDKANDNLNFETMFSSKDNLYLILSSNSEKDYCLRACFSLKLSKQELENVFRFYYLVSIAETMQEKAYCEAFVRSYLSIIAKNKKPEVKFSNIDSHISSNTEIISSDAWKNPANLKDVLVSKDFAPVGYCGRITSVPLFLNVENDVPYIYYVCLRFGNGGKLTYSMVKLEVLNSSLIPQYKNNILKNPFMDSNNKLNFKQGNIYIVDDIDMIYVNHNELMEYVVDKNTKNQ